MGPALVEVFLTKPVSPDAFTWEALVHPGRKMRTGERIVISEDLTRGNSRRVASMASARFACSRAAIYMTC